MLNTDKDSIVKDTVKIYEGLRKAAEKNVLATGVENLSYNICEYRIVDNPAHQSKDIIVSVDICGKRETLTIRFDTIQLHCNGNEDNTIRMGREIAEKISERVAQFVGERMGESLFRSCAASLVRMK